VDLSSCSRLFFPLLHIMRSYVDMLMQHVLLLQGYHERQVADKFFGGEKEKRQSLGQTGCLSALLMSDSRLRPLTHSGCTQRPGGSFVGSAESEVANMTE